MAITAAPVRPSKTDKAVAKTTEQKTLDVINKGGKPTKTTTNGKGYKNFNIRIFDEEMAAINDLRALRPKPRRGTRLGISLHDWLVEAIEEKIERDTKKIR
jgi:hypothetical protein